MYCSIPCFSHFYKICNKSFCWSKNSPTAGAISKHTHYTQYVLHNVVLLDIGQCTLPAGPQATLVKQLQQHCMNLSHTHYRLPLSLSMLVSGMEIEKCSFFNSNTVPLKLTFINHDPIGTDIPIIFKVCHRVW